jgi:glycosyltransferase involved in cell wall biosynthesis
MNSCHLAILGTRGIPSQHGGFETFAEKLALYLVSQGWQVTVYCQEDGSGPIRESAWQGVRLIHIPIRRTGASGTVIFDWKSTVHAANYPTTILSLGYGTAIFSLVYRLKRRTNLMNMDGLEWHRAKWNLFAKSWLWCNELAGCLIANHLIADHPEIKKHLATRCSTDKITMIPYGSDAITDAGVEPLEQLDLKPGSYALVIARPDPDNSLLEIVSAFSSRKRGLKLVILGDYQPDKNIYQRRVMEAASTEVVFAGPIYDKTVVAALRFHCRLYLHGHRVGGTNPSLVEALGAGSPVLAHDNKFNRWVAGGNMAYFANSQECADRLDTLLNDHSVLKGMRVEGRLRHADAFTWDKVLASYERRLEKMLSPVPIA